MRKPIKPKMRGYGLEIRTFVGENSGSTYLVFRTRAGAFHSFVEASAKDAAIDCGSGLDRKTKTPDHWVRLWKSLPQSK